MVNYDSFGAGGGIFAAGREGGKLWERTGSCRFTWGFKRDSQAGSDFFYLAADDLDVWAFYIGH